MNIVDFNDDEKIILGIHGRFAYLINELEDYVTAFEYSNGILKHLCTEKAYEGGGHGSADIHVSPDMFIPATDLRRTA